MGEKVALDTPVFIYYLEGHSDLAPRCRRLLADVERGKLEATTSTVCVLETLVRPLVLREDQAVLQYKEWFTHFPHLTVKPMTMDTSILAAELRAEYGVGVADAVVGATAIEAACTRLITNDDGLRVLEGRGLRVELLAAPRG